MEKKSGDCSRRVAKRLKGIAALVNDSVVGVALHVSCIGNAVLCAGLSYLYMTSEFSQVIEEQKTAEDLQRSTGLSTSTTGGTGETNAVAHYAYA